MVILYPPSIDLRQPDPFSAYKMGKPIIAQVCNDLEMAEKIRRKDENVQKWALKHYCLHFTGELKACNVGEKQKKEVGECEAQVTKDIDSSDYFEGTKDAVRKLCVLLNGHVDKEMLDAFKAPFLQ